jgi:2-hydroxychromene-2-carboxylate isomerase
MGELIRLSERKADLSRPSHSSAAFFFALGCPFSYLAAERVERAFGEIEWVPLPGPLPTHTWPQEALEVAEREAAALRLPFAGPDRLPADCRPAARAAVFAARQGLVARFALAVSRLVFCGGFELDDPETISEAAGAADLSVAEALGAAEDSRYDAQLDATAQGLRSRGVGASPVIRIGRRWFSGLEAVPGASSLATMRATSSAPSSPAV